MPLSTVEINGEQLQFTDSNGDSYYYIGNPVSSFDITGNWGIVGEFLFYKDEEGMSRVALSEDLNEDGEPGYVAIDDSEPRIIYGDENGDMKYIESPTPMDS